MVIFAEDQEIIRGSGNVCLSEALKVTGFSVLEPEQIERVAFHSVNEPVWRNVDRTFALQL